MKLFRKTSLAIMLCLAGAGTLAARAEEPKASASGPAPSAAPIGRVSVASFNELKKLIADLGIPIPLDPRAMIEGNFPFIGPGGLQGDKPIGLVFIGGEKITTQDGAVLMFPVAEGKAGVESFAKMGGVVTDGHADMVSLGNVKFRRTANYLMMYQGATDLLAAIKDDIFAKDYTRPGRLALLSLDLAAARKVAPTKLKAMFEESRPKKSPTSAAEAAGEKMGIEFFESCANKFDRFSLAIGRDEKNVHMELWLMPVELAEARRFPCPTFPADVVAQMHIAYPNAEAANWASTLMAKIPDDAVADKKPGAAANPKIRAAMTRFVQLFTGADAQSMAVQITARKPVLYLVNQYGHDVDAAKEMQEIATELNAANKDSGDGDVMAFTSYKNAAGQAISRLTQLVKGKQLTTIDVVQHGRILTFSIADDDGQHVDAVAALPAKGEISKLCTGSIDLDACLSAAESSGQMPPLPPEKMKQLHTSLAGQAITWSAKANAEAKYLYVDVGTPFVLFTEAGQMAMMNMMMPPPATRGGGAGPAPSDGGITAPGKGP